MSSKPLLIRYPGGDAEFYWGTDAPSVGDTIGRNGDWIVSRVEANLEGTVNVTVGPAQRLLERNVSSGMGTYGCPFRRGGVVWVWSRGADCAANRMAARVLDYRS